MRFLWHRGCFDRSTVFCARYQQWLILLHSWNSPCSISTSKSRRKDAVYRGFHHSEWYVRVLLSRMVYYCVLFIHECFSMRKKIIFWRGFAWKLIMCRSSASGISLFGSGQGQLGNGNTEDCDAHMWEEPRSCRSGEEIPACPGTDGSGAGLQVSLFSPYDHDLSIYLSIYLSIST